MPKNKTAWIFLFLWCVTFIFYLPAAQAGKIGDYYLEFVYWVRLPIGKYMSVTRLDSVYYFTLLIMLAWYKIFGLSVWAWHMLTVTLNVFNATILYIFLSYLLDSAKIKYACLIAMGTALLFSISPYNTEVIVNRGCFHFTLGLLMLLLILLCTQRYIYTLKAKYAWWAVVLFAISCYSIEIFYLTPVFTFTLVWYYCFVLKFDKKIFIKVTLRIILPELIAFLVYLFVSYKIIGTIFAHRVNGRIDRVHLYFLFNSSKSLFHAIFLGRFFPQPFKDIVYHFWDSNTGMALFGGAILSFCLYVVVRFKKFTAFSKLCILFVAWILLCLALIATSFFPGPGYVTYDRYIYFMLPFVSALILLLLSKIKPLYIVAAIAVPYFLINVFLLIKMNNYWYHSSVLVSTLMKNFPLANDGKIILLLNPPENLNGVLMIGAHADLKPGEFYSNFSAFKLMYNSEHEIKITNPMGDIASFNMKSTGDGAHVRVVNDSVINVMLNQQGTSWWQYYTTAISNDAYCYTLNMIDTNHWYQLTLKQPASQYTLLYTVGDHWKTVDFNKKGIDQY